MSDENKALVKRFFAQGPSQGDQKAAGDLLASDFALHVPLPCSPGVQGMNEVISACRAAFEHLDVAVETMVAEGEMVAARFTARAFTTVRPRRPATSVVGGIGQSRFVDSYLCS